MNVKHRTSLRVAAVTAASAGILSALGLAAPAGTAAHDTRAAAPARPAQPLATTPHTGAKAAGVSQAQQWPTLRSGSRGPVVTAAQHLLTARRHAAKADGVFGSRTAAAVKAFQRQHRLRADGVVGAGTWNALANGRTGATPATRGYVLKFTKNWSRTDDSALALYRDGRLVKRYRAGSGMGSTDECAKGRGWLPSGTYKVLGHQTNRNSRIKGYAIHLADKVCRPKGGKKAVTRGDLFIHSNMTKNGASRWRGNYKTEGCIKLSPPDIKNLFAHLNKAHWPKNLTLQVS